MEQDYEKPIVKQNYEEPAVAVEQYDEKPAVEPYNEKQAMGDKFATYYAEEGKHKTDRKMKLPQQEPSVLSMCPEDFEGEDIVGVPVALVLTWYGTHYVVTASQL